MKQIRVLHNLVWFGGGGVETLLLEWMRRLPQHIHFDFLVIQKDLHDAVVEEYGSQVHVIPHEIVNKPWKHAELVGHLVRQHNYNVIHNHRLAFGGYIMKEAHNLGVPCRVAHSRTTLFQESRSKKLLYLPYHWTINRFLLWQHATHILACSNDAGRFLMGYMWGRLAKCQRLFNGVPTEEFQKRMKSADRNSLCERYGIPKDAIITGHLGRMEPVKNQVLLLDAFNVLTKRDPRHVLFIGGEGALRRTLEDRAKEHGIMDRVYMPGFCENVPELLGNLFDVFCLPSFAEGFGNVLIEATAAGLFSVCSDTITKDITGYFPDRMTVLSLKASPERWADLIEMGFSKKLPHEDGIKLVINSPFTTDKQLNTLLRIYEGGVIN